MTDKKIGRDAGTGEFISVSEAQRRPASSIVETIHSSSPISTHQIGRDASTGQFISVSEAHRRPTRTVVQNIDAGRRTNRK
jgi:hypothetical protein